MARLEEPEVLLDINLPISTSYPTTTWWILSGGTSRQGLSEMAKFALRAGKIAKKFRNRIILRRSKYVFRNFENYDNVSIYPSHKLILNRIKKSGNTTIIAFLNDVLIGNSYGGPEELKKKLIRPSDLNPHELRSLSEYRSAVFVRNPYDRVLSAYLGSGRIKKTYGSFHFGPNSKAHFHEFLNFLDSGGLYVDRHWWPQVDLLFQPPEEFSFVGKLENVIADMAAMLRMIGVDTESASRLKEPHEIEMRGEGGKIRSAGAKSQSYYTDDGRAVVARLYRRDFETFDYTV